MKVAFLKPHVGGILGLELITFIEPLGLECVAGSAEAEGHECRIIDLRLDGREAGLAKCKRFEPDVVGLQCNFTTERYRTVKLAREVKRDLPGVRVIVGGHDASRVPEWFVDPAIDAIAVGDGEEVMPGLLEGLDRGRDLARIPGLVVNTPGGQKKTDEAPARRELDQLPRPARHLIDEYWKHYYINFRKPMAAMETARGCPYRCNFCSVWNFHEKTFREKSPERVVEELAEIKAPHVLITDDIFWLNPRRGEELARAIKASGIKKHYTIQTRSDIITSHPELVESWRDLGRLSIFLGLEAIDDEGLKLVNKNNKAVNNNRAIEILQELDVGYAPNFIVDPAWDRDHFARLREWIEKTGAYNSGFTILTPLPGTELWGDMQEKVTTHDWELYDIMHSVLPTRLPLEEFYDEYTSLWRKTMEVRHQHQSKAKNLLKLGAALATGKVSVSAFRKGMNMVQVVSRPENFMRGHRESTRERVLQEA